MLQKYAFLKCTYSVCRDIQSCMCTHKFFFGNVISDQLPTQKTKCFAFGVVILFSPTKKDKCIFSVMHL